MFVLAFGESLAFVSLILPFWAMLVGIGAIIGGTNPSQLLVIVAAAASGAALGDWLSYWLGYHYHEQIQSMWPLKNHPTLIENGRMFFKTDGACGRSCLARFSGPLRASVPIVAGITRCRAEVPNCQLEFGVPVGVRAAFARRFWNEMVVRLFLLNCARARRPSSAQ